MQFITVFTTTSMRRPREISTANRLIYAVLVATFILDLYELWYGDIGLPEAIISWVIYALIALIPYGLNRGNKAARTWFCICFAVSVVLVVLLLLSADSMSDRRWVASILATAADLWILRLLFSTSASAWLGAGGIVRLNIKVRN